MSTDKLTLKEALAEIRAAQQTGKPLAEVRFREIVRDLELPDSTGKTTVVYSNTYTDGIHSGEAANALYKQAPDNIRIIDKTPIDDFLNHPLVTEQTEATLGHEVDSPEYRNFVAGDEKSLWGLGSRNFAENTKGEVIALTPNAKADRIYVKQDLPWNCLPRFCHIMTAGQERIVKESPRPGLDTQKNS